MVSTSLSMLSCCFLIISRHSFTPSLLVAVAPSPTAWLLWEPLEAELYYRLASHFLPFDDFSHTMKATAKKSTTAKNIVK